jgi:hypothetical protein
VGVNALMALWTYHQYRSMLDYCSGFGRSGLECLPGGLWEAVFFEVSVWFVLEVAALVVLGAAVVNRPREARHLAGPC